MAPSYAATHVLVAGGRGCSDGGADEAGVGDAGASPVLSNSGCGRAPSRGDADSVIALRDGPHALGEVPDADVCLQLRMAFTKRTPNARLYSSIRSTHRVRCAG